MPTGISGSNAGATINGLPVSEYQLIESRVISNLLQAQSGNQAVDSLAILRNDQAFELGLPTPVIGN